LGRDSGAPFAPAVSGPPPADPAPPTDPPARADPDALAKAAPPMTGVESLTADVLQSLWLEMTAALHADLDAAGLSVQAFLRRKNPAWNVVGRVHFNLAE